MNLLYILFFFSVAFISPSSTVCQSDLEAQNGQEQVIDFDVERDLELFYSVNNSHKGVLAQFDHTFTTFGRQRLVQQFKNPTIDVVHLKKIQAALDFLVTHDAEQESLNRAFGAFGFSEQGFAELQDELHDRGGQEILKKFYFDLGFLQGFNDDAVALNLRHYGKVLGIFSTVIEHLIFHYALAFFSGGHGHHGHHCHHEKPDKPEKKHKHKHKHDHGHDHHDCAAGYLSLYVSPEVLYAVEAAHLGMHLWSMKEMAEDISAQKAVLNILYKNIAALSTCVKSMQQAYLCIQENNDPSALMPKSSPLVQFFAPSQDSNFNDLRDLLLSDYFDQDTDLSFFSSVGTTLRAYKLIQANLAQFQQAFSELGFFDALVSIAKHIKPSDFSDQGFCFVEFVQDSDVACINFKKSWNVGLGADSVTNDFISGFDNASRKIILTGPNKAGKTSFMKLLALNIILAQTWGIAAAESACMTPFHKISSCMIVTDDIATDQSKFVAGLMRADKILQAHKKLNKGQFIFVLLDDSLLDGTTFEKRQQTCYQFIKELGTVENNILLAATHLPLLTTLEQETRGMFKNYRMKIVLDAEGKKQSTFSLEEGICAESDVFDIIDAQDYNVSFIQRV